MGNAAGPDFACHNRVCPGETALCGVPGEEEQEEARDYICRRIILRPDTDIKKALGHSLLFLLITQGLALTLCLFLKFVLSLYFPPSLSFWGPVFAASFFAGLGLCAKRLLIGLVKLYQHYAPERIRRKCIFKPTCSEYMILAIEKYGPVRGLYKGLRRLFIKCRGYYYSIDYP
jgi:putative component of membrane protein insertase Oxa1/YidC/SpoIIIJ protein YidD